MSVSALAASPAIPAPKSGPVSDASPLAPTPANDTAPAAAPAVQVSLSAEAELSVTVIQETKITISETSGSGASGTKDGSQAAADPKSARALSTLQKVADDQRAWIKALEAQRKGHHAHKADGGDSTASATGTSDAGASDNADGAQSSAGASLQISIEQDTVVQAQLTVGAQVDVKA